MIQLDSRHEKGNARLTQIDNNQQGFFLNKWRLILLLLLFSLSYCSSDELSDRSITNQKISPEYNDIQLQSCQDSLHFNLPNDTYNEIKNFNYFTHNKKEYISFYDRRSQSINIYSLSTKEIVKKIVLKGTFTKAQLFKASIYVENFDSILMVNQKTVFLLDTLGSIQKSITFLEELDVEKLAFFENTAPPIFTRTSIFMGVRPYVKETSLSAIRQWRILYKFDMQNQLKKLHYSLPHIYKNDFFGYPFLKYSYCFNNNGNFVFSFPADTCIYETNLSNYHMAYFGKSRFQNDDIIPVTKKSLLNKEASKQYALRNSYGPIYFDPYKKRYLRLAKQKINETDYIANTRKKKQSIIILNEDFKIIAEHEIDGNYSFSSLFFSQDGSIYARVNSNDQYAIHFVRLIYVEKKIEGSHLTKNWYR